MALGHEGSGEYLKDHKPEDPNEDPTYCWGYVERCLCLSFNLPAYLRHTLNRVRNHQPVDHQMEVIARHKRKLLPAIAPVGRSLIDLIVRRARE